MCILYSIKICSNYRGEKFRTAFARLGELRSALPSSVRIPVLAVTATSTKSTYNRIVKSLLMEKVCIVGLSPNRDNIFYGVIPTVSLSEFFNPIAEQLKEKGKSYPKTLIFCRSYNDCNVVYDQLQHALGHYITFPAGYPKILKYRMITLYTRASSDKAKEEILQEFVKCDTSLRIIVATTAFGMGIDCPDIAQVIHWGPLHTIEEYVQESGRGGRNLEKCYAT